LEIVSGAGLSRIPETLYGISVFFAKLSMSNQDETQEFHVDIMDLSQLSFEDLEGGATEVLRALRSPLG
jgi:hypothetical protein